MAIFTTPTISEETKEVFTEETKSINTIGLIVVFSFISIIFVFITLIIIASINNYALSNLLTITNLYVVQGMIEPIFGVVAEESAQNYALLLEYIDYVWLGSFVSLFIASLVYSYLHKRQNYFTLLSLAVFGIIIFTYIGGIFVQITEWFKIELLEAVFPFVQQTMPFFAWYLEHTSLINLILFSLIIVVNFVDFDMLRFKQRKREVFDEI